MIFTSFQAINTYASPVHRVHTEFVYMSMFLGVLYLYPGSLGLFF